MPLKGEDSLIGADDDADGGAGEIVTDFDERLKLRLDAKEAAAAGEPDVVRFGESGWKDRYYAAKLHAPIGDISIRRYVVKCYVEVLPSQLFPPEPTTQAPLRTLQPATHMVYAPRLVAQGLCWVLMYYYQGVQDWGWFYPFHYAPCASDLVGLDEFAGGQFDIGAAFTPFQQLMAVFPPASGHALPSAYRAPPPTIASSLPRSHAAAHRQLHIALLPFHIRLDPLCLVRPRPTCLIRHTDGTPLVAHHRLLPDRLRQRSQRQKVLLAGDRVRPTRTRPPALTRRAPLRSQLLRSQLLRSQLLRSQLLHLLRTAPLSRQSDKPALESLVG